MKNLYINFDRGYTLIELLVVVALTIVVAGFIFVGLRDYSNEQRFNRVMIEIKALFRETQQKTTAAETDSQFGIYFATSSIVVFEGSMFNSGHANNITYNFLDFSILPELSGGALGITFARLYGEPSATGTIAITNKQTNATRSLLISNSGLIE